jgi:diguanylate cyclase (GGDEF)-like protein/putative nucleotidyltransferase with HDIG domain
MNLRDPSNSRHPGRLRRVSLFVFVAVVCGALALRVAFDGWHAQHTGQLVLFLAAIAVFCSPLIPLPSRRTEILFRAPISLLALATIGRPESILIMGMARLLQSLRAGEPSREGVMLETSLGVLTAMAGGAVYHARWLRYLTANPVVWIAFAALTYFAVEAAAHWVQQTSSDEGETDPDIDRLGPYPEWLAQHMVAACTAAAMYGAVTVMGWESLFLIFPTLVLLYWIFHRFRSRLDRQAQDAVSAVDLHLRTIQALALAIEAKDTNAKDHLKRMRLYSVEVAGELGLGAKETQAVEAAALLHDVGKLAVPEYIFTKPGPLTPQEFDRMRIHPQIGAQILETVGFPYPVAPIVRAHHENWDGSGYPNGLSGAQIPTGARILAAVDFLDSLMTERPHRAALPMGDAVLELRKHAGSRFDPAVVTVLERCYPALEGKVRAKTELRMRAKHHDSGSGGPKDFTEVIASASREIHTLLELNSQLGNSLVLEDTFSLLASQLKRSIPFDSVAVYTVQQDRLSAVYTNGIGARVLHGLPIELGQGLSGWVAQTGQPVLNGRVEAEFGLALGPVRFAYLRSALAVPLRGADKVLGSLTLYSKEPNSFTNDHLRLLLAISEKTGLAIENALRFREEQASASTDGLTGLPNARALFGELNQAIEDCKRNRGTLAVLVTDLDNFKRVNDQLGHLEGNRLLQRLAEGMRSLCRASDYVARMGGDEFVILLRNPSVVATESKVKALQDMVAREARMITAHDWVSLSAGFAVYPVDGTHADELLTEADKRMYEMKAGHHTPDHDRAVQLLLALGDQIR